MLQYNTYLLAIGIDRGQYVTASQCEAHINIDLIRRLEKLHEIKSDNGPREYIAILQKEELPTFFLEEGNVERRVAEDWFNGLGDEVRFIFVQRTPNELCSRRRDKGTLHRYVKLNANP
jgi:hypothetical protein